MDDLAICLSSSTSEALIQKTGVMISCLLDNCFQHAMTPNMAAGKTELMLSLRWTRIPALEASFPALVVTTCFTPLGSIAAIRPESQADIDMWEAYSSFQSSDLRFEAHQRLAIAHQSFTRHRRLLFRNPHIAAATRSQIFDAVVMSSMSYGCETWVLNDLRTKKIVHGSIMKLYQRLQGAARGQHAIDDAILTQYHRSFEEGAFEIFGHTLQRCQCSRLGHRQPGQLMTPFGPG